MTVQKTVVEEGEDLPVHRSNILNTRVISEAESGIDPFGQDTALEVWYLEKDRLD